MWDQARDVVEFCQQTFPHVADYLEESLDDLLAFTNAPKSGVDEGVVKQPHRKAQPGDQTPHRRRGDLPQPRRRRASGRGGTRRATRVRRIQQKRYMSLTSLEQTKGIVAAGTIDAAPAEGNEVAA